MAFTPVQKLSITTGAAMVLLSAVGLVAYLSTSALVDAQEAAAHTNDTIHRLEGILEETMTADNALSRYVATGGASERARLDSAQSKVESALDSVRIATDDHPEQRRMLDSLGPIVGAQFRDARHIMLIRDKRGRDSATVLLRKSHAAGRPGPARLLGDMRDEEVRVLGERTRVMAEKGKASRTFIIAGSLFAFVLALVALQPLRTSVERRLTARLSRVLTPLDNEIPKG